MRASRKDGTLLRDYHTQRGECNRRRTRRGIYRERIHAMATFARETGPWRPLRQCSTTLASLYRRA